MIRLNEIIHHIYYYLSLQDIANLNQLMNVGIGLSQITPDYAESNLLPIYYVIWSLGNLIEYRDLYLKDWGLNTTGEMVQLFLADLLIS